jgi:hypothetical protein
MLDCIDCAVEEVLDALSDHCFSSAYRLEMPLQLMERLEQEGRIRPFTPDECRRFALDCDLS